MLSLDDAQNATPRMHMVVWPVICSSCRCSICSVQVLCGSCADAITECVADSWRCTHSSFSTGGSVSVPMTSQNSMNNSTGSSSTAHVSTYRRTRRQLPGRKKISRDRYSRAALLLLVARVLTNNDFSLVHILIYGRTRHSPFSLS